MKATRPGWDDLLAHVMFCDRATLDMSVLEIGMNCDGQGFLVSFI